MSIPYAASFGIQPDRAIPLVSVAIIVRAYGDSFFSLSTIGLKTSPLTAPIVMSPMRSSPSLISTGSVSVYASLSLPE